MREQPWHGGIRLFSGIPHTGLVPVSGDQSGCWGTSSNRKGPACSRPSSRNRAACGPRQADRLGNLCKCRDYWRLSG